MTPAARQQFADKSIGEARRNIILKQRRGRMGIRHKHACSRGVPREHATHRESMPPTMKKATMAMKKSKRGSKDGVRERIHAPAVHAPAGDSSAQLIDARIKEPSDWRRETLARVRLLIKFGQRLLLLLESSDIRLELFDGLPLGFELLPLGLHLVKGLGVCFERMPFEGREDAEDR